MLDIKLYESTDDNAWCPGCGNFAILDGLKQAMAELEIPPHQLMMVSGIGQAAKTPHYIKSNVFNGLHGRGLPPAQAIKMVNKDLKVVMVSGDGDSYGEGGNHFLHAMRRNVDMVHMVNNNQIYGLTKGQGSPTTAKGHKTSMQFEGVYVEPLSPLAVALTAGATFVARGFSGDKEGLTKILKEAMNHPGYALVEIMQPCVVFNKINTFRWYRDRVYYVGENYDKTNKIAAIQKALQFGDEGIPLGILYQEIAPTYHDLHPVLQTGVKLVDRKWVPTDGKKFVEEFL